MRELRKGSPNIQKMEHVLNNLQFLKGFVVFLPIVVSSTFYVLGSSLHLVKGLESRRVVSRKDLGELLGTPIIAQHLPSYLSLWLTTIVSM